MGQILRKFNPLLQIANAQSLASPVSVVVPMLHAAGMDIHVEGTQSGGSADGNIRLDIFRVYDGSTADDETVITTNIQTAVWTGTKKFTRFYRSDEHAVGLGWGVKLTFTYITGNRTTVFSAWVRRMFEVDAVGS